MAHEIVARDEELGSVRAFVSDAGPEPAALVLEGEVGVGKSTLWAAGTEEARAHGRRVLLAQPAEAEQRLAYGGLGDLLEESLDDVLGELAPPRRRALEVALLREPGEQADPRALGVAVRGALLVLGAQGPLVVAVDDVQWLDAASSAALAFALRRLPGTPVRLLLARRVARDIPASPLEQVVETTSLRIGPLTAGALHRLLFDRLGRPFPRQTLLRIHEMSAGNPFYALELARALGGDVDPLQPLPVPETLEELLRARIARLPSDTREALTLASALGTTSETLLRRAGVRSAALDAAADANVAERRRGSVRFTHPLLASVLYSDLGEQRLAVHARLAELVDDPASRARHLALSRDAPDDEVAAALEETALRSDPAVAGELHEHTMQPGSGHVLASSRPASSPRSSRAPSARRSSSSSRSSSPSSVRSCCCAKRSSTRAAIPRSNRRSSCASRGSGGSSRGRSISRPGASLLPSASVTRR